MSLDRSTLEAALIGYHHQLDQITKAIADIRAKLGAKAHPPVSVLPEDTKPRKTGAMSAAGRKRIAAAQKKRWATFHAKAGTVKPAKRAKAPKRTMSPAAKARLVANLAKARAAKANKRAAQTA
jgi:hypothetical protein